MWKSVGEIGHMMISQGPMAEISVIENPVASSSQQHNTNSPDEKCRPGILVQSKGDIVKIMVPYQERYQKKAGNFR